MESGTSECILVDAVADYGWQLKKDRVVAVRFLTAIGSVSAAMRLS